jgi:hypothetical protein
MDGVLVYIESSWLYVHEKLNVESSENYQLYRQHMISYEDFMRRIFDYGENDTLMRSKQSWILSR